VLLAKDILIQLPAAIPQHLQNLLDVLVPASVVQSFSLDAHSFVFAPKTFPQVHECIYVVVLLQVCAGCVSSRQATQVSRSQVRVGAASGMELAASGPSVLAIITSALPYLCCMLSRMNGTGGTDNEESWAYKAQVNNF
jgi:hypothetical protein